MEWAAKDRRFALPPIQQVSEKERQEAKPKKYINCMLRPSVNCLLDFGLQASLQDSHLETHLQGTAIAAMMLGQSEFAFSAMDKAMIRLNIPTPNPFFAEFAGLKAEAALQKDDASVEESAKQTFVHATTLQRGYENSFHRAAIKGGLSLARVGHISQARHLYEIAKAKQTGEAQQIIGAIGLTLAQKGRLNEAMAIANELHPPQGEAYPEASAGLNGACAVNDACGLALAGIAEGLAEKGERAAATNFLSLIKDSSVPTLFEQN